MTPFLRFACLVLLAPVTLSACGQDPPDSPPSAVPDGAHTSQNALDWAGTYRGTLPCADCPGIETILTLNADGTYARTTRYLERGPGEETTGKFTWSADGGAVRLDGIEGGPSQYMVGENYLVQLDLAGNRVAGAMADRYVLNKLRDDEMDLAGTRWTLVALNGGPVEPGTLGDEMPYLEFEEAESGVSGYAGCNRFSGSYERAGADGLVFSPLIATRMACSDMTVETQFLDSLDRTARFRVQAGDLSLLDADGNALATLRPGD